jgi:hypothetical protein
LISNDAKRQKAYECLRKLLRGRICRALGLADEDLVNLSLSRLINLPEIEKVAITQFVL